MRDPIRVGYGMILALGINGIIALLAVVVADFAWWIGLILLAVLDVAVIGWAYWTLKRRRPLSPS